VVIQWVKRGEIGIRAGSGSRFPRSEWIVVRVDLDIVESRQNTGHSICRENRIPYFGLCSDFRQPLLSSRACVWFGGAHSTEFNPQTPHPGSFLSEQEGYRYEERWLGVILVGLFRFLAQSAYQKNLITERHRHRYEVNNRYRNYWNRRFTDFRNVRSSNLVESH